MKVFILLVAGVSLAGCVAALPLAGLGIEAVTDIAETALERRAALHYQPTPAPAPNPAAGPGPAPPAPSDSTHGP